MWIIFVIFGLVFVLSILFRDEHQWQYHNPFDRTCTICGRHEVEECWGEDFERKGFAARGWWEVYREGDPTKHKA
jgi:hypothetical protein